MVFESQLALRRVYRVQGFENISIITYNQKIFKSTYQSVLKICHIRLFFVFCSSLTDVMIDFSDQLHDIFPKFRIKARFFQHFCGSSSSINDFLVYSIDSHVVFVWANTAEFPINSWMISLPVTIILLVGNFGWSKRSFLLFCCST